MLGRGAWSGGMVGLTNSGSFGFGPSGCSPSEAWAYATAADALWPGWALLLAWGLKIFVFCRKVDLNLLGPDVDPPAGPPDVLCPGWVWLLVWG